MNAMLNGLGNVVAGLGLLICLIGGVWRVLGHYYLGGFQISTLFSLGLGLLMVAILLKVEILIQRS